MTRLGVGGRGLVSLGAAVLGAGRYVDGNGCLDIRWCIIRVSEYCTY